jgi:hypothetical protein
MSVFFNVPFGGAHVNFDFEFQPRRISSGGLDGEGVCFSRVIAYPPGTAEIHAVLASPREAVQWAIEMFGDYQGDRHVLSLLAQGRGSDEEIGAHAAQSIEFFQAQLEAAEAAELEAQPFLAA